MESVQIFARFMVSCASFDFRSLERQQFLVASQSLKGSLKGGDPAAPSGTAALLRLNPSYQFYLGRLPPCPLRSRYGPSTVLLRPTATR